MVEVVNVMKSPVYGEGRRGVNIVGLVMVVKLFEVSCGMLELLMKVVEVWGRHLNNTDSELADRVCCSKE